MGSPLHTDMKCSKFLKSCAQTIRIATGTKEEDERKEGRSEGGRREGGRKEGERKGSKEGRTEGREEGAQDYYYSTTSFHYYYKESYVLAYLLFFFWYVFRVFSFPALAFCFCVLRCFVLLFSCFPELASLLRRSVSCLCWVFCFSLFGLCVSLFLLFVFCVAGRPLAWHCFLLPVGQRSLSFWLLRSLFSSLHVCLHCSLLLYSLAGSCLPFPALCISLFALLAFLLLVEVGRARFAGGMPFLLLGSKIMCPSQHSGSLAIPLG